MTVAKLGGKNRAAKPNTYDHSVSLCRIKHRVEHAYDGLCILTKAIEARPEGKTNAIAQRYLVERLPLYWTKATSHSIANSPNSVMQKSKMRVMKSYPSVRV